MASRGVPQRGFILLASAALAALPLVSGLTPVAPAPAAHADAAYPNGFGGAIHTTDYVQQERSFTSAGVANLLDPNPTQGGNPLPPPPDPASVTASAGSGPIQGAAILRSDLSGSSLAAVTLDSLHLETLPIDIPLSTIPIQRATAPHTWQELLAPTVLAGIPLQNVTWKQVDALSGSGRPAALDAITMADVDWSGSVLADLPLAAFTFGGADITSVAIPVQPGEPTSPTPTNAERWCYVLNEAQAGACPSAAALTGQSLIGIGVRGAPLKDIPLKDIPLKDIDLATSPLKDIPLKDIVLNVAPLKDIPLKDIDLAASPLKDIPLKDIDLATSPLKDIPLKDIAWASSPLKDIPLKDINLAASPLKDIPLKDIDFATAPLKDIPLKDIDLATSPLKDIPLKDIDFATAPLKDIPLKDIDISASPLKDIPLKDIDLAGAPLKDIPLKDIDFSAAPLKDIPLKDIDLASSGLGALPLSAILWGSAPLAGVDLGQFSFASGPLSTIPIASTATPADIAGCAAAIPSTCAAGETLGQAAAAHDILPTATLADIGATGFAGHGTLADLIGAVPTGSTLSPLLGDLRLDLAGPAAPVVTIEALVGALTGVPDPVLGDLRLDLSGGDPTLGDLRLDLVSGAPGTTVNDLLALLSPSAPDVLLGDLRIDLIPSFPALTLAAFVATLSSTLPDVLLGDLRLDQATGVDALVLNALSGFLLDPTTFAPYLLGALGTYTDITGHDITLGELGIWTDQTGADITLGELAQYLDDSVSLSDVLLGLVPATQFPYQDFPIASLGLNKAGRDVVRPDCGGTCVTQASLEPATLTYMEVQLRNSSNSDPQPDPSLPVDVEVVIPAGADFAHVETGSRFDTTVVTTGYEVSHLPDGRTRILVHVPPFNTIGSGANDVKVFWANALQLGPASATYRELDPNGTVVDAGGSIPFNVQDGAEPNTPVEEIALSGFYSDNGRVPVLPVNANGCSASSPSCTSLDPTYIDDLMPGFISVPGDVDWYELPGVRAGSRISVDLTNLPLDADLVLYGPAGTITPPTLFPTSQVPLPGQLVEDPGLGVGQAATSIASQALSELRLDNGYSYPDHSLQGPMTPLSISQHSGTDPESVGVIAPVSGDVSALVSGNYVVAVSGHNGATSNLPYLLRARVTTPTDEATCAARTFPNAMPAIPSAPVIPADANTVFLTNQSRLVATYGQAAADDVAQSLTDLVAYLDGHPGLGIVPVVVPVDAYQGVRPAYDAWDDAPCSVSAANAVAAQITGVLRDIQTTAHGLAYVTIVGGDDIVPMGRVPDLTRVSNESEYTSTFGDALNPVSAAEAASDTLTDDVYGDTSPTSIGNGNDLFVPRLSVGRLVETPADIEGQLGSFVTNQGILDTHTGLVAGYDFLADGADAVASRLAVGGRTVDDHLIDQPDPTTPWTQADLLASLFPAGGATPLVDSINAHYDHTALLPSAGNTGTNDQLETAADIASRSSAGQLAGRVLFTMGCHAGLAVPDAYVTGTDAASATLRGDWSQTLSAAGVSVYVANTGYGIGDTSSVAYSERLMGLFSKLLDGSLTAGQALAYAKQAYYGSLGAVGVYDTKILQEAAFYGLPFWRISPSGTPTTPTTPTAPALPGTLATDPATGLQALPVTENLTFTPESDGRGTYWKATGPNGIEDPQVTHYQPIEPRTTLSVVTDGQTAHGALVTSLTSHDELNVDPVLDTPTADLSASAPEVRSDASAWPGHLATITTSVAPYGRAQSLVLVPGRFLGSTSDGTGEQRLFDSVGASVLYSPDAATDFAPPTIDSTSGDAAGSTITFKVVASDAERPVKRVLVGYHDFDGTWRFTDLVQQGTTTTWTGTATASHAFGSSDGVEYFAQVVDAAGNVGTASDKATGYTARVADTTPPTISASVSPAPNAAGWVAGTSATVTFTCGDSGTGLAADACPEPVTVTAQGSTTVSGSVTDESGNTASTFAFVQLDGNAPTISAAITPAPNAAGWGNGASATVIFTCTDGGSGLTPDACPAAQTVTSEGATDVPGTVTDIAGNSTTVTATVRLDRTAPTISATVTPTPNAAGWGHPASATVTFACDDPNGSGIPDGACPSPQTVTDEGVTSVSGSVSDRAGNQASITADVRIDRTAPVVTVLISAPPHMAACATSDDLSGVAVQASLTTTTSNVNGIPTTTAVCSSATDFAGNSGSATATFVAPMTFSGFISPVNGAPVVNTGKTGRTYPIKFQLRDAQGAFISALPAVTSTTYQSVTCSTFGDAATDPLPTDTSGSSGLRYDTTTNQFSYTWKTPGTAGCYVFRLGLADGTTYSANFKLQ